MIAPKPHITADVIESSPMGGPAKAKPVVTDLPRIEAAVREILAAIGEDPDREGLQETPRRVAKAYAEIFGGLAVDPAVHLSKVFHEGTNELVIVRDIDFHSVCEHHLLPIEGKAHIAYQPSGSRVVGLSKLARTVEAFARRPQVQERMTAQIADAIHTHLRPEGVLVIVEADHFCMKMRGVGSACANTVTMAARGLYRDHLAARAEVVSLIQSPVRGRSAY